MSPPRVFAAHRSAPSPSSARPGGFAGDLRALSVAELIQTLALGGGTARIVLRSAADCGEMWFREGSLIHAEAAPLFGELAVYAMLAWTTGEFDVEYGAETEARSIVQDTTYLVLEGLRRIDERPPADLPAGGLTPVRPEEEREAPRRWFAVSATGVLVGTVAATSIVFLLIRDSASSSLAGSQAAAAVIPAEPPPAALADERPAVRLPQPSAKRAAPARRQDPRPAPSSEPRQEEPLFEGPVAAAFIPEVEAAVALEAAIHSAGPSAGGSMLHIVGKSNVTGGTVAVLVDGHEVFARPLDRKRDEFEAFVPLAPGEHVVVTRVNDPDRGGLRETTTRGDFEGGASRTLRVSAGRALGSPVRAKLERSSAPDTAE